MRKIYLAVIFVFAASRAFCDATEDLFEAVRYENTTPEKIYELVAAGAKINAKSKDGYTILMRAASVNSNPEVIRALILSSADVNAKDTRGFTALTRAVLSYYQSPGVVKALTEAGANVNARSNSGNTILMQAAKDASNPKPEVIKILLEASADIYAKNSEGKTVLDYRLNDDIRKVIADYIKER